MDNKVYKEVSEILEDQMKKIVKKGDISPQELELLYKTSAIVLDFDTREAMKGEEKKSQGMSVDKGMSMRSEYSQHYPPMYWQRYMNNAYDGNSYDSSCRHEQMSRDGHSMDGMSHDRDYSREQWGNSRDGSYRRDYSRERDYSRDGYSEEGYNGEGSYRRGRDARGRYTSRGYSYDKDYSRVSEKERMLNKLESMLDDTSSEKEKRAIEQCIERISK